MHTTLEMYNRDKRQVLGIDFFAQSLESLAGGKDEESESAFPDFNIRSMNKLTACF